VILFVCLLRFPDVEKLNPPILQLDEVYFYYSQDAPIFRNVTISANLDSRICIVSTEGEGVREGGETGYVSTEGEGVREGGETGYGLNM